MGIVTNRFGQRLKEIREAAELTQQQLADELKVSRGAISYYEKGERTPDIEFLHSLSSFSGLELDFLMGNTMNNKSVHKNMYEYYGLTDSACEVLNTHPNVGHIISRIITDTKFSGISSLLYNLVMSYKEFDSSQIGYMSFLLTELLKHSIENALSEELEEQYTLEETNTNLKVSLQEMEETEKKLNQIETALLEHFEKSKDSKLKELKNTPAYIARKKIEEKFNRTVLLAETCNHLDNIEKK